MFLLLVACAAGLFFLVAGLAERQNHLRDVLALVFVVAAPLAFFRASRHQPARSAPASQHRRRGH
jgi:hypothetical protein